MPIFGAVELTVAHRYLGDGGRAAETGRGWSAARCVIPSRRACQAGSKIVPAAVSKPRVLGEQTSVTPNPRILTDDAPAGVVEGGGSARTECRLVRQPSTGELVDRSVVAPFGVAESTHWATALLSLRDTWRLHARVGRQTLDPADGPFGRVFDPQPPVTEGIS
jgi:hypothetical protein